MNKIFFLLFFSVSSIIYSQKSVSGFVVDDNNLPIEFANVLIKKTGTNTKTFGAITDTKGAFNILLDANMNQYKITVSFIGFETWSSTITIDSSITLKKIILKEKSSKLNEIVIISKTPTITKKEDKIIFNVQNSPLKSGYDGVELLKNTPNIFVDENENILMRNETATILINGRKVNMAGDNLTAYLTNLNSDNIKSIEIQTNKGVNTDATSTGGIINIVLKKKSLGFKSQLNFNYVFKGGDYYTLFPGINMNYGTEKWNLYGNYNLTVKDNYTDITNDVFFYDLNRQNKSIRAKETNTLRNSFQLGLVRNIHKNHVLGIEIFGKNDNTDYSDNGKAFYYFDDILSDKGLNNTLGNSSKKNINGVLNYSWKISENNKLNTFIDYTTSTSKNNSEISTTYEKGTYVDNINTFNSNTETTIYSFQTDFSKKLKNKTKLDVGTKYIHSDRDNKLKLSFLDNSGLILNTNQSSDFNYQENIFASYISFDKTFKDKNYLKIGIRIENTDLNKTNYIDNSSVEQHYTSLFPSAYFSRKITSNKTISASYSKSLRRPSFQDLSNDIIKINDFQFVLGNPDLQPEFIDKYELNYQHKKSNISVYYNNTREAINGVYFLEDDVAFYKKFNAGSQIEFGIEYRVSKKINDWWFVNFSSYLYNRKYVDEQDISLFEKTTFGVKLYNNFKISKTTSFDLATRYRSPKSDAFYELYELYTTIIGFKKTFYNKKLSLRIDFKDVFNSLHFKERREFSNYATLTNTKPITRYVLLKLAYNLSNNTKISGKKNKSKNDSYKRL